MARDFDHNPWLAPRPGNKGSPSELENYAEPVLLRWQTRAAPPSAYEERLADALGELFGADVVELADIVAGLNAQGIGDPDGAPWTEASFEAAMQRLGDSG